VDGARDGEGSVVWIDLTLGTVTGAGKDNDD